MIKYYFHCTLYNVIQLKSPLKSALKYLRNLRHYLHTFHCTIVGSSEGYEDVHCTAFLVMF